MNLKKTENAIKHIATLQESLSNSESNLQYIKRLQALMYWLHKFDSYLDSDNRQKGQFAATYESYFYTGCGFSFYNRECNSITAYQYGERPF